MQKKISIGWASVSITPDRPIYLYGQLYYRISKYVHDPITATALAISNDDEQLIFLSADMACMPLELIIDVRQALNGFEGIDSTKIVFSATHTHNSDFAGDPLRDQIVNLVGKECIPEMEIPANLLDGEEARYFIVEKFITVIKDAWTSRVPGGISFTQDYAVVGFNRRPQFDLGNGVTESKMYGDCSKDNFLRFEGSMDHTIDMLYTWDLERKLTGVLVDVPCPSQVMELHCFISADYWHYTRREICERFGSIYVLGVCGAAGDQNPLDLIRISKDNKNELVAWNAQAGEVFRNIDMGRECENIASRIADAVSRGYRNAINTIEMRPIFHHKIKAISLPIRMVTETDYKESEAKVESIIIEFSPQHRMQGKDLVRLFEPLGIVSRWKHQQQSQTIGIQSSIIRLGISVICTNPFELFVEYGMRIRARSKAKQTFIFQLTNGCEGYLPTKSALEGGSYSSKPASTLVGPEGGKILTETIIKEINQLWEQEENNAL